MNDLHERVMNLTPESVRLRRRLSPDPSECPVNDDGHHDTYGGICHCGWSSGRPDVAGRAIAPDRQELSVMLADIEASAVRGNCDCNFCVTGERDGLGHDDGEHLHDLDDSGTCRGCGEVVDCGCPFRGHGFRHVVTIP